VGEIGRILELGNEKPWISLAGHVPLSVRPGRLVDRNSSSGSH
jgi:hypothetical protein